MVTIAVAAILLSFALPSFQSSMRSNRVGTATNELLASLALARSEAVRNTRGAGICSSTSGAGCDGTWDSGWLVWADTNSNGALDEAETVVRYTQAKSRMSIAGSVATLAFDQRGRVAAAQTFDLQSSESKIPARCVMVGPTGQTRVTRAACL